MLPVLFAAGVVVGAGGGAGAGAGAGGLGVLVSWCLVPGGGGDGDLGVVAVPSLLLLLFGVALPFDVVAADWMLRCRGCWWGMGYVCWCMPEAGVCCLTPYCWC